MPLNLREPSTKDNTRLIALGQALFVTLLWSSSWVIIKIGLRDLPALTFAGLRYSLACVCLLPFASRALRQSRSQLDRRTWANLLILGVLYYTITQGAQFLALAYLPAVTVSLMLNFTSVIVAALGIVWLSESPSRLQWLGMSLFAIGAWLYFYPIQFPAGEWFGLGVAAVGVLANALSAVVGRRINRSGRLPPIVVTIGSMGPGALLLTGIGLAVQGLPALQPIHWAAIGWLAVVNTALAFTLWNHTLRSLSAVESSVINSTMLVQIAILAVIFLGESLSARQIGGLGLAALGVLAVQVRKTVRGDR